MKKTLAICLIFLSAAAMAALETVTYTYDDAGRLTQADYGGGTKIDYVYDANGNLLQRTVTAEGTVTYTLVYLAGTGGSIDGLPVVTQQVAQGQSGTAVSAVVEDAGAAFHAWSDGVADQTRTDTNVQGDLDVTARFRSTGGADLDWYDVRGYQPGVDKDWSAVDATPVEDKGTTLRDENIADTEPADTNDVFRVLGIDPGPPPAVIFRPGSPDRVYTLYATGDLAAGSWTNVPGAGPRTGQGEAPERADTLTDTNAPPHGPFYRIHVELKE